MPDFDLDDIELLDEERDILFSRRRWEEIARSIPLDEIPREMKNEIADFLIENLRTSNGQSKSRKTCALKKLIESIEKLRTAVSELQGDLNSEEVVHRVMGLVEQTKIVQSAASSRTT